MPSKEEEFKAMLERQAEEEKHEREQAQLRRYREQMAQFVATPQPTTHGIDGGTPVSEHLPGESCSAIFCPMHGRRFWLLSLSISAAQFFLLRAFPSLGWGQNPVLQSGVNWFLMEGHSFLRIIGWYSSREWRFSSPLSDSIF